MTGKAKSHASADASLRSAQSEKQRLFTEANILRVADDTWKNVVGPALSVNPPLSAIWYVALSAACFVGPFLLRSETLPMGLLLIPALLSGSLGAFLITVFARMTLIKIDLASLPPDPASPLLRRKRRRRPRAET
ncbi:hypothetical protein IZ6_10720 [Terrihabitans soli]|uniref:Uncharacterized protein n=1 Tax=Terrihabitans soli TaxID=708113 RepID=A0A6S6QQU4_9HYPH|nr:hypothetical protein [Terrihabitans soli]BCJ90337.1 hypothetical protein IZ6_10720 [Terrihabitans soli]